MSDQLEHEGTNTRRLDRVESDVATMAISVTEVRSEMRSVFAILGRIEASIAKRDEDAVQNQRASRPNIVAISAVLVTIIIALITVAWATGGEAARSAAIDEQREIRLQSIDQRQIELDRRIYEMKGKQA